MQAGGSMFAASQAVKQSKYQQDILGYQADYIASVNKIQEERIRRNVGQVISAQRAQTAASGFQPDTGTAKELQIASEIEGEIDIAILRSAGSIEQLRLRMAGYMARAQGYGMAAGYEQRGFGSLLSTGMNLGSRQGWFAPSETKTPTYGDPYGH